MQVQDIHDFGNHQNKYTMNFFIFIFLIHFDPVLKYCIIPPFNVDDDTPYNIAKLCHDIPFEGEKIVNKHLFIMCTANKQSTHQIVHFKQH